ncbi:DUF4123 domain-containing protein [Pseudomonas carnis]|uniref:DUF4123 domain-containing protein n=1 Tax=Pseudomonas carnis TaxID=2487355 RepID=UPI0018E5AC50|nr:DUF4123 domain-containing protein [Pseudomonas carnis]MBI6655637.1 DUF4123 domain-containing protein [Pseudomonas carnis]MBI6660529.1 DUF4123 domain-containing protein [Pseudomonas carnis]MBI6689576.1 DUF4123 domain-containing protein [Pseudomonas carnis]
MSEPRLQGWLDLLEVSCAEAGITYLDIIIDQAGGEIPLIPSVLSVEPALQWHSLFTGLPEEAAVDLAPLLLRVDMAHPLQRQWLIGVMQDINVRSQVLVMASVWPFYALADHLRKCMEARNGGCMGVFRFYDPRLFSLLFSHVLLPEQQQLLLHPVIFWSWLDRDGVPRHLPGRAGAPELFDPIELSDSQIDTLCCASDATLALSSLNSVFPEDWKAEQRFQVCYAGMLEASQKGLLTTTQREAYILNNLSKA